MGHLAQAKVLVTFQAHRLFSFGGPILGFPRVCLCVIPDNGSIRFEYEHEESMKRKVGVGCALGVGVSAAVVGVYNSTTLEALRNVEDLTRFTKDFLIVTPWVPYPLVLDLFALAHPPCFRSGTHHDHHRSLLTSSSSVLLALYEVKGHTQEQ